MTHLKMLVVGAVAAIAVLAFAAPASATSLTSPKGTVYTGPIDALASQIEIHGTFTTIVCHNVTFSGKVESHGSTATAGFKISTMEVGYCSNPLTVLRAGSFEIHTDGAAADGNGTVTWSGYETVYHTSIGECTFATSGTNVGTLTGSDTGYAVWKTNSASIPITKGNFFCGTSGTLTGSFTISPKELTVD